MTIIKTIWLVFFLSIVWDILAYYLFPWIDRKIADEKAFREQLILLSKQSLDDHVEQVQIINEKLKNNNGQQP